jgi:hypothetical protein
MLSTDKADKADWPGAEGTPGVANAATSSLRHRWRSGILPALGR